jgi:Spy/CpxP family protein refolding chaperone
LLGRIKPIKEIHMKTKLLTALLLALPLFSHAAPISAVDGACDGKMPHSMMHPPMSHGHAQGMRHEGVPPFLHGANLTEAQKDQVFKLMHTQAPVMREKAKAAQQAMEELRALGQAEKFDETRAKSLADNAARAHAEMALLHVKTDQQIYTLLTPEQRSKIGQRQK